MEEKAVYVEKEIVKAFEPVSVKEWLITILILMIPIVNLVMMFVWAFGNSANPSKANYFKAMLIWALIGVVLWFVLGVSFINMFSSVM